MRARNGQIALLLAMTLVAITILVVMNVGILRGVRAKNRVQNAGDAAALAAARVQGELLNALGRLNVEHAKLLVGATEAPAPERIAAIETEQRRLAFLGPVDALVAAHEAAHKNKMEKRDEFSEILRDHVNDIRTVYAHGTDDAGEPYPEPWPGAWEAYAQAIEAAIGGGLATGPDNCEFYDARGGHMLLNRSFYHAIAGRNWCWFHFNAESLLKGYGGFTEWSPLPPAGGNPPGNCEIFPLHVVFRKGALADLFPEEDFAAASHAKLAAFLRRWLELPVAPQIDPETTPGLFDPEQTWCLFDEEVWRTWTEIDPFGEEAFPVVGKVKPEYDLRGCAAICRCVNEDIYTWAAAAKPFGAIEVDEGLATAVSDGRLVVPCFEAVRLVPLDAVGGEDLATADGSWVEHVREHLGEYLQEGPKVRDCFWCEQLVTWENAVFRAGGVSWIKLNSATCIRGSGGSSGHGGTSHGH